MISLFPRDWGGATCVSLPRQPPARAEDWECFLNQCGSYKKLFSSHNSGTDLSITMTPLWWGPSLVLLPDLHVSPVGSHLHWTFDTGFAQPTCWDSSGVVSPWLCWGFWDPLCREQGWGFSHWIQRKSCSSPESLWPNSRYQNSNGVIYVLSNTSVVFRHLGSPCHNWM